MSGLPRAVQDEFAKREAAERRRALDDHAREQQRARAAGNVTAEVEPDPPQTMQSHLSLVSDAATREQIEAASEFNWTTDAASLWLSFLEMPPKLRGFVDAVCGLAGAEREWFNATDVSIAKRMGRCTKTVYRDREELSAWQIQHRVTFIEIEDHKTVKGIRIPHRYRVHLSQLAVAAKTDAQASPLWSRSPAKAMERAVKAKLSEAPGMRPRREHRRRERSLEDIIMSDLRRAGGLMLKSAERLERAEVVRLAHDYTFPIEIKPEIISALEHTLQILKGAATPDKALLAPLNREQNHAGGQNVRKQTIHSPTISTVAVDKSMPTDATTSDYMRVPSIARATLENRGNPPPAV